MRDDLRRRPLGASPSAGDWFHDRPSSDSASLLLPFSVSLYFCNRLLGFSGIVYSISLSSIKRRITSLSRPDTDLWPKPFEISDLDLGVCRSIDSIRCSMPFALDFCLDSCLTLALFRCGSTPLRSACGTLSLHTSLRPRSTVLVLRVRGTGPGYAGCRNRSSRPPPCGAEVPERLNSMV